AAAPRRGGGGGGAAVNAARDRCEDTTCDADGGECQGNTCVFVCDEDANECNDREVDCPDNVDCRVECIDDDVCTALITGPNNANLDVQCQENDTCTAAIDCAGTDSCEVTCEGDDSCSGQFSVDGGNQDVTVDCEGS